jgi:CDGSH-type Zn-finger protein
MFKIAPRRKRKMGEQEKRDSGQEKRMVIFTKYSPYMVVDLKDFRNAEGKPLPLQPVMSLCRCGKSANKPFCYGSHKDINFDDSK